MGFWKAFVESLTPEGRQKRYDNAYERITGSVPVHKPGKLYHLYHLNIRKHQNGTATIHLHGEHRSLFGRTSKRIEYITVKFLPGETDAELVRCAAWMSPNKWKIPFSTNISQFSGKFYQPLDDRLKSTLTDPSQISSSS